MKKFNLIFFPAVCLLLSCNENSKTGSLNQKNTKDSINQDIIKTSSVKKIHIDTIYSTPKDSVLASTSKPTKETADTAKLLKISISKVAAISDAPLMSVLDNDVQFAYVNELWAWNDHSNCKRIALCFTYIGNFEITFSNGKVGFNKIVQRVTTSAHDCIQNAKNALLGQDNDGKNPDRALAVAWIMASQIHNKAVYEWYRTHGDATLKALALIR